MKTRKIVYKFINWSWDKVSTKMLCHVKGWSFMDSFCDRGTPSGGVTFLWLDKKVTKETGLGESAQAS